MNTNNEHLKQNIDGGGSNSDLRSATVDKNKLATEKKHHMEFEEISGNQYNSLEELQAVLLPRLAKLLAAEIRQRLEEKKLTIEMNKVVFNYE